MKRLVPVGEQRVDARKAFGFVWVAVFLSLAAILALVYFAAFALRQPPQPRRPLYPLAHEHVHATSSIRRWPVESVYDENFNPTFLRSELEAELLLNRSEEGRNLSKVRSSTAARRLDSKLEIEV